MYAATHEEDMYGAVPGRRRIVSGAMVETPEHNKGIRSLQFGIKDTRIAIGAKIRLFVTPKVRPRHNSCCAVRLGCVAAWYK